MKAFLLLCLYCIGSVGASHFFVTAPNVLRFNQDEPVLVNVFDESNYQVEIWLQIGTREFSQQIVNVLNEKTPSTTTIKVTEDDLFPGKDDKEKPTEVTLHAKTVKGTFSKKLLLSYNTGYIIMHTSKPMYNPNENVHVRALAMTETLKFAKGWNISMDIISPSNLTFGRKSKVVSDKFFEDSFILPPLAEIGLWTIKAFYRGQYKTEGRTNFQVQEYVLPTFGVQVDVIEKVILDTTDQITITVDAKYVYKKPVKGRAVLKISCLAEDGVSHSLADSISRNLVDGTTTTIIDNADLKLLKDNCGGFPTLDGQRLHVSARVIESATSHEEIGSYKQTVFSQKKYKFNFENSKKTYRPGLSYNLRVLIKLANGGDPGALDVKAKWSLDETLKSSMTDAQGNALIFFVPSKGTKKALKFIVMTNAEQSEEFIVEVYNGDNQIQIEQVIKRGKMIIEATVQGIGETGIMSLLLSRGRYIDHIYFPPATNPNTEITKDTQEKISPEARVVAFFITSNGTLVADSTKFSLKAECRGPGLELKTDSQKYSPNDFGTLTITGSPRMGVGLNVMDKALLLLDNNNVLRKSKMFEMMKSHDLGCGEGGGSSAEQVFRDAGLTVVTSAIMDPDVLDRKKIECESQSRKKRSTECSSSQKPECCTLGSDFAVEVLLQNEELIDRYATCYGQTKLIAKKRNTLGGNKYSYSCLVHHFKKCVEELFSVLEDDIIAKSALDSSNAYLDALNEYNLDIDDIFVRKDFKDSWLFRSVDLDDKGKSDAIELKFPSSITDWMIQAIGISEDQGLCISEPHNVTAVLPFFIQLDMPYKASRLEYFEIKVTIFNYENQKQNANIKLFIAETKGLCTGLNPQEAIADIEMKTNDAYSVRIPILALEAGKFPIKVTAIGKFGTVYKTDAIEKELLVVNEGVEEREVITVCLHPFKDETNTDCVSSDRVQSDDDLFGEIQRITVNLTLPHIAIKDTGSAHGYASSNVMDDVVKTILSGINNMLRQPCGCGEQTMIYLGPSVYVMSYWKNTKQMTPQREIQGNQWIRGGVKRELTYRKSDGSYAAWLHRPSSTWLTAFVGKVFCQAKKVVDDAVNIEQDVVKTMSWLEDRMDENTGMFIDDNPVIHREMIGQIKENDPSLTAFVLITLLECDQRTRNHEKTKQKAMEYLENIAEFVYRQNPYLLAISTYALALADSTEKYNLYEYLTDIKNEDIQNNFVYWGSPKGYPASKDSVETTSYAMLALMQFTNGVQMVGPVVRWLSHQRSAAGSFRTTQDTVIGLQALSEYTIKTFSSNVKLEITLAAPGWKGRSQQLNNENRYLLETIKDIPVKGGDHFMTVTAKGEGSGKLIIDYRYNRQQFEDEKCDFDISDIIIGDVTEFEVPQKFGRICDVCGVCEDDNEEHDNMIGDYDEDPEDILPKIGRRKRNAGANNPDKKKQYCVTFSVSSLNGMRHGMSIIDVGLETGMQVKEEDLKKMEDEKLIDSFEMPENEKGFFILYLNEITSEKQEFKFRLEDHFGGDRKTRQPTRVQVYDYYKPEFECIQFYGTGPSGKSAVEFKCDSEDGNKKETCSCLQNICPSPDMKTEIIKKGQAKMKDQTKPGPAQILAEISCDFNRANFAVLMKVTSIVPKFKQQLFTATAVIVRSIHQGTENLETDNEIELYWRMFCSAELLKKDKMYYLIAMDGETSRTKDGDAVSKYQLMDSTVIVEWNDSKSKLHRRERFLQKIMNVYENTMKRGCPK